MTPAQHLALLERDRLVLLARLEAELLINVSPPCPGATLPVLSRVTFVRDDEVTRRIARHREREAWKRAYDRYVAEKARERALRGTAA